MEFEDTNSVAFKAKDYIQRDGHNWASHRQLFTRHVAFYSWNMSEFIVCDHSVCVVPTNIRAYGVKRVPSATYVFKPGIVVVLRGWKQLLRDASRGKTWSVFPLAKGWREMQEIPQDYEFYKAQFCDIPDDAIGEIVSHMSPLTAMAFSQTSKTYRQFKPDSYDKCLEVAKDYLYARRGRPQDWSRGMDMMKDLARVGNDYALMMCGWHEAYMEGRMIEGFRTMGKSNHVCTRALKYDAKQGDVYRELLENFDSDDEHFMHALGITLKFINPIEARHWYEQAAHHPGALFELSRLTNDVQEQKKFLEQSARIGCRVAQKIISSRDKPQVFDLCLKTIPLNAPRGRFGRFSLGFGKSV